MEVANCPRERYESAQMLAENRYSSNEISCFAIAAKVGTVRTFIDSRTGSVALRGGGANPIAGHNSFPFFRSIRAVDGKIVHGFELARGPENFYAVEAFVGTETKVDSEVVLGEIASTTADLIHLNEFTGDGFDARIQSQAITLGSRQFEFDPVVVVPADIAQVFIA